MPLYHYLLFHEIFSSCAVHQLIGCLLLLVLGLGRAPPKVITVEYDPNDVDAFIEIADAIEEAFPKVIVNGNEQGPGRPGSFEVRVNSPSNIYHAH